MNGRYIFSVYCSIKKSYSFPSFPVLSLRHSMFGVRYSISALPPILVLPFLVHLFIRSKP